MCKTLLVLFSLLWLTTLSQASDYLLYFEAQGIAGYSSAIDKEIFYSQNADAEMQKPSIGIDFIKRFSGEFGDIATFALQARLALDVDWMKEEGYSVKAEGQVYNAYLKVKTPGPYVWVGHNRPAFGLSSYFDSHALLLRTLAIQGFGYDRDWGVGMSKDFSWGDVAATFTTGSGMPIYFKDNYMIAARGAYGVLSRDNFNLGVSGGYGNTLATMGYTLMEPEPRRMALGGVDFTFLMNNLESRFDFLGGKWFGEETYALMYRFGINLGPEARLKLEAQPMWWKFGAERDYQLSLGLSFLATSDLTLRLAYTYDHNTNDNRVVLQVYYYRLINPLLKSLFRSKGESKNESKSE
jgi:hypothetical protein